MTKLDDLKTHIHEFDTKTRAPIKANKGGDTWVKVQQIADKIAEEKKRVALAGDVIKRVGLMQMEMNQMNWDTY